MAPGLGRRSWQRRRRSCRSQSSLCLGYPVVIVRCSFGSKFVCITPRVENVSFQVSLKDDLRRYHFLPSQLCILSQRLSLAGPFSRLHSCSAVRSFCTEMTVHNGLTLIPGPVSGRRVINGYYIFSKMRMVSNFVLHTCICVHTVHTLYMQNIDYPQLAVATVSSSSYSIIPTLTYATHSTRRHHQLEVVDD